MSNYMSLPCFILVSYFARLWIVFFLTDPTIMKLFILGSSWRLCFVLSVAIKRYTLYPKNHFSSGLMVGIYNDQEKITKKGILFRSNSDSQLILSNRQSQTTRLAGFNCFSTSNLRSRNMMSYLFEMSQKTTISNRKKSDTRVFTKPFRKLRKYLSKKRKKKTEEL